MNFRLNLQMFADGEAAGAPQAAGAESAAAETAAPAESASISAGDSLPDGTRVQSSQVAAAMNRQMMRHPELRGVYGKANRETQTAGQNAEAAEKTIEQRWDEAKRGEFAELYGKDVQNAIKDRFKNQADASEALKKMEPMLKVLRERAGVETDDELIHHVMDDDSLYEDAANEAGMTVAAYRQFMEIKQQRDEMQQKEQENMQEMMLREHFGKLSQQAEEMRQSYPGFDLQKELENRDFLKLTSPDVGLSVEDAYFAVHHKELAPQMMAYGMQRAQQQLGQTLQAQRKRPAEGAMRSQGQPAAAVRIDPRQMTRREREEIKRQVRMGKRVSFD